MNTKIAVIGLGYVGLPLACAFAKKHKVVGFDINEKRLNELNSYDDKTREINSSDLKEHLNTNLSLSNCPSDLKEANFYIITVPTPIDDSNRPDLRAIFSATKTVASVLKKGDIVVYESTVYPGLTEEECAPLLQSISKLTFNEDFFCGFSPERINPADKLHTITKITKVTSGSTPKAAQQIDELYKSIIVAGTYLAPNIKTAEAAKVIENTQRDINIAFMNELSMIFERMDIDTKEVLKAASTKWNFLNFRPGLVGGHCIGVDPYYLTHKAQKLGYHPEIILSGRRINDGMPAHIASAFIKMLIQNNHNVSGAKVLFLGITFKENCPDIRNSKAAVLVQELKEFGCDIDIYDPHAYKEEVQDFYGLDLIEKLDFSKYVGLVLAVGHDEFKKLDIPKTCLTYDVQSILQHFDKRL